MKTNQPFLFKNEIDQTCLLFCKVDNIKELKFGNETYSITPWKIWFKNLDTEEEYPLNLPLDLSNLEFDSKIESIFGFSAYDIKKQDAHLEFIIFCNPHLFTENGKIIFCYVAGLSFNDSDGIRYYIIVAEAEDLTLKSLNNFVALRESFTGTKLTKQKIVYCYKNIKLNNNAIIHQDSLVVEDLESGLLQEVDLKNLGPDNIYRIVPIFNSGNFILTCTLLADRLKRSFIIDNNFTIFSEILTPQDKPVYKSSILENKLIYTKVGKNDSSGIENRSLEIIDFKEDVLQKMKSSEDSSGKINGLKEFVSLTYEEARDQKILVEGYKTKKQQQAETEALANMQAEALAKMQAEIDAQDKTQESGPSLLKMAGNFATSMKHFAKSGFLRVTEEQHAARMDICNGCEFWKQGARFGMGKCLKCGCSGAKQWIATSVCPINKWGAISKEEVEASKLNQNASPQTTKDELPEQVDSST
jgi:hypothetical protein